MIIFNLMYHKLYCLLGDCWWSINLYLLHFQSVICSVGKPTTVNCRHPLMAKIDTPTFQVNPDFEGWVLVYLNSVHRSVHSPHMGWTWVHVHMRGCGHFYVLKLCTPSTPWLWTCEFAAKFDFELVEIKWWEKLKNNY